MDPDLEEANIIGGARPVPKLIDTIEFDIQAESLTPRRGYRRVIGRLRDKMNLKRGRNIFRQAHYVDLKLYLTLNGVERILTPKFQKTDVYLFGFEFNGVLWEFGNDPRLQLFTESNSLIYTGTYKNLLGEGVNELSIGYAVLQRLSEDVCRGRRPIDFKRGLGTMAWIFSEASRFQPIFRKINSLFLSEGVAIMPPWSVVMVKSWRKMCDEEKKISVELAADARRRRTITNRELQNELFLESGIHAAICVKIKHVSRRGGDNEDH